MYYLLIFVAITTVESGNVLFLPPLISASHKIAMVKWAEALSARGHQVYWWAPAAHLDKYQPKNATLVEHFAVKADDKWLMDMLVHENVTESEALWTEQYKIPFLENYYNYLILPFCEDLLKNHRSSLENFAKIHFDFVVMDEFFNACGYIMAGLSKSPIGIYVSTCRQTPTSTYFNGVPRPLGYTPSMGSLNVLSDEMSFLERVENFFSSWIGDLGNKILFARITAKIKNYLPEIIRIEEPMIAPDFQFLCSLEQLQLAGPRPKNLIYIGGSQLSAEIEPLSEEWQDFIDKSKRGFIVIAMGHWVKWKFAPAHIKHAFVEALKKVPKDYHVVWQYEDTPIANLPNNIKQAKWLPQRSLLADPNCKLFINHGGCNGVTEAIYHAVPMLAIPLTGDQPDGAAMIAKKGLGIFLKKQDITTENLHKSIMTVIRNESYGINVRKMADNIKADAMAPLEKAVFWTEFAMRHKGGAYYKSTLKPERFDWVKHYCVDIGVVGVLMFAILVQAIWKLATFITVLIFSKNEQHKTKTE